MTPLELLQKIKDALSSDYDHYMDRYYEALVELENAKTEEDKQLLRELLQFYLSIFDMMRTK